MKPLKNFGGQVHKLVTITRQDFINLVFILKINMNTILFIEKAQKIHGKKFSYKKTSYRKFHEKLTITCKKHGDFQQSPYLHLRGSGCSKCSGNNKLTTSEFIQKAKNKHGIKYLYDKVVYLNNKTEVTITCKKHGEFNQRPTRHLSGDGCPKCAREFVGKKNTKTTKQFIEESRLIHQNIYDYKKSNYKSIYSPLIIICPKHGEFKQKPHTHLKGSGCPFCGNNSKGELKIKKILDENKIEYIPQKLFNKCVGDKRKLPFDFYLPKQNILIEFDGIQHFKPVEVFGGKIGFEKIKNNDNIKNNYASNNNILLYRIKYNENLEKKMNKIIMENTQIHPNLITVVREDISVGMMIAQSCHSVADFAYHKQQEFTNWRENSNYKICLASKDEQSLIKLHNKLIDKGAKVIAFREPDLGNEMTAITLLGEPEYRKYTQYLPLAGKKWGNSSMARASDSKPENVGSTPTSPTNNKILTKTILNHEREINRIT